MAHIEEDEDAFIGRRLKGRRRPIDLSLGYYLNANEDTPMDNGHSNVDQSRRALSSVNTNQDVAPNQNAGVALETVTKENQVISRSKSPVSVDRFLTSTSKVNATRNYKQARKRKIKEKRLRDLNDTEDYQDPSGQVASAVKPPKKAGRTHARHRAATRDLSVPNLRGRVNLSSRELLHRRWQPVQSVRTVSSVDNRLDTGTGDGLSMTRNRPSESRVPILPPGWKNMTPPSVPSIKVPRKPARVRATHDAARSALSFEPIEEHDKKLDLWLGSGSHGAKVRTKPNAPLVRGVPPLTFSVVVRSDQLNMKALKSVFNMQKSNDLSQIVTSVVSYPQRVGIPDEGALMHSAVQINSNTVVPGQKLTHLGDMLGELRLSAKEFCHASENVPSPGQ